MGNWDVFLYTRGFPSIDTARSSRHVSKLLTYPLSIGSILHESSPYTLRNQRLLPEGLRSLVGEFSLLLRLFFGWKSCYSLLTTLYFPSLSFLLQSASLTMNCHPIHSDLAPSCPPRNHNKNSPATNSSSPSCPPPSPTVPSSRAPPNFRPRSSSRIVPPLERSPTTLPPVPDRSPPSLLHRSRGLRPPSQTQCKYRRRCSRQHESVRSSQLHED